MHGSLMLSLSVFVVQMWESMYYLLKPYSLISPPFAAGLMDEISLKVSPV
jgi:hypothetical protein